MPLWVSSYFAAYTTFCIWSYASDLRDGRDSLWSSVAGAAGDVCLLVAAASFWLPALLTIPASMLFGAFIVGCVTFLGQGFAACRRHTADPDLSLQGKLFVGMSGSVFGAIVNGPLLVWGFESTVLGSHAGI